MFKIKLKVYVLVLALAFGALSAADGAMASDVVIDGSTTDRTEAFKT